MKRGYIRQAAMLSSLAGAAGLATPALAQSVADLQATVATLEDRIEALEEDTSGGWEILPGTTLRFYGYAKVDLLYDLDFSLGNTIFGVAGLDATSTPGEDFTGHAFQTRLGFDTTTETDLGTFRTKVEGDFFGAGGGQFRLRHAYGALGGFLGGQTWTNWMPIESYPGTLDFQGPAGIPFARRAQLRYTFEPGSGLKASFSIEDDPSALSDGPALTAAASYSFGNSFVKIGAVSRQFSGPGGDENGYGVNLSGNTSLWEGGSLQASYTTGEGIGSYMVFGGADLDAAGDAIETEGITLGLTQALGEKFSLGIAYGMREIDFSAGALGTDTEELETIHLSLTYSPIERVTVGLEYITGERTDFNGASFDADRIQASAQFNF